MKKREKKLALITIYVGKKKVNKNGSMVISSSSSFSGFVTLYESNGRVNSLRQTEGVGIDPTVHYVDQEKVYPPLEKKAHR